MKYISVVVACLIVISCPAFAQNFDINLTASPKNISVCRDGDSQWEGRWRVAVSGDEATISNGTPVKLKKMSDGNFEATGSASGQTFTFALVAKDQKHSLKIYSKAAGCLWEGSSS